MMIWKQLLSKLYEENTVCLLVVVDHKGSSPGRSGFKMMVSSDGYIQGSIGGGVMEFNLVEEARKHLRKRNPGVYFKRQVHSRHKEDGSGMICSGEQTVVFVPLSRNHLSVIERIERDVSRNETCPFEIGPEGITIATALYEDKINWDQASEETWKYRENIGKRDALFIIGGGHVSLAVSELFVSLGFYVTVLDDRDRLNTLELNHTAHRKKVIDFDHVSDHVLEGNNVFVAIMTNKFTDDMRVLKKLIRKEFKYIGVLGSKAKLETMWTAMLKEEYAASELKKVSAPIGLSIKSQTPMEIAVSIAAEIIALRNG